MKKVILLIILIAISGLSAKEHYKFSLTLDPTPFIVQIALSPEYRAMRWASFRIYSEKEEISFLVEPMSHMGLSFSILKHLRNFNHYALGGTISLNRIPGVDNPINIEAFFRNEWTTGTTTNRRKQNAIFGVYLMPGWGMNGVTDYSYDTPKLNHGLTFRFGFYLGLQFMDT